MVFLPALPACIKGRRSMPLLFWLAVMLVCAVNGIAQATMDFDTWRSVYHKRYELDESLRRLTFITNLERYAVRNAEEGLDGAVYGPDPDSDVSMEEMKKRRCFSPIQQESVHVGSLPVHAAAATIDWRNRGAVAPVQQQHPFGTCWAFAATAALEGITVVQGKQKLQKLSEQQLISCSPPTDGGQDSNVLWKWLKEHTHGSLATETSYPYNRTCNFFREQLLAPDGTRDGYMLNCTLPDQPPIGPCPPCPGIQRPDGAPACRTLRTNSHAKVSNWGFVASAKDGSDDAIVVALLKYGPGTMGIDAACLFGYRHGVISNCSTHDIDHAVTLVGAGATKGGVPYFIVKNSWGVTFGEDGYFRVARNKGLLGINGAMFACYSPECSISVDSTDVEDVHTVIV